MKDHGEIADRPVRLQRRLGLWDTVSIIVGIVIGSSLYVIPPVVANSVSGPALLVGAWLAGGAFALIGSLCYAELATTYPEDGGDYVYLSRAYGRWMGLLFAWLQLGVVRPGSIGFMAFVFAQYAATSAHWPVVAHGPLAAGAVVALAGVNLFGLTAGKWTQNILAALKVIGLLALFFSAFQAPGAIVAGPSNVAPLEQPPPATDLGLAMILILFAYGGWNDMALVAAEVREPEQNILRALLLGVAIIAGVYVLAQFAMLHALGFEGLRHSSAVVADMAAISWGESGRLAMSLLICVSALGAINGMTLAGSRIYFVLGRQHRLFAWLGQWNAQRGVPARSIIVETLVTLAMIGVLAFTSEPGVNAFEQLAIFTAPPFWLFLGLSVVGLIVLRFRDRTRARPFRVPLYPVVPLAFVAGCGFMAYSSVRYAYVNQSPEALWPLALFLTGLILCAVDRARTATGD